MKQKILIFLVLIVGALLVVQNLRKKSIDKPIVVNNEKLEKDWNWKALEARSTCGEPCRLLMDQKDFIISAYKTSEFITVITNVDVLEPEVRKITQDRSSKLYWTYYTSMALKKFLPSGIFNASEDIPILVNFYSSSDRDRQFGSAFIKAEDIDVVKVLIAEEVLSDDQLKELQRMYHLSLSEFAF